MNPSYVSLDPGAEINGASLHVALAAFQITQQARNMLLKHGLPENPRPNDWYPVQAWLDVLANIEADFGSQTVYAVGLQVVKHCVWPDTLQTLPDALRGLHAAHQANVRGRNTGYYHIQEQGPRTILVECFTPVPLEFDCGIITGLARKFRPAGSIRVQVVPEPRQPDAPAELKRFLVSW